MGAAKFGKAMAGMGGLGDGDLNSEASFRMGSEDAGSEAGDVAPNGNRLSPGSGNSRDASFRSPPSQSRRGSAVSMMGASEAKEANLGVDDLTNQLRGLRAALFGRAKSAEAARDAHEADQEVRLTALASAAPASKLAPKVCYSIPYHGHCLTCSPHLCPHNLCFTPPHFDIRVGSLPAYSNGFITFGCFNKISRMTDEVVAVRAEILRQVPDSKLFLKDQHLAHEKYREQVTSRFAAYGISANRLILEGSENREQYLRCYNRVDIGLSPFPYGGGTTVAESLWMGTPVVVKKGSYFLSHIGESILNAAGLSDWIAKGNEEFINKAVAFSGEISSLAELRQKLRKQALSSPLFDAKSFASNFEKAAWGMAASRTEKA